MPCGTAGIADVFQKMVGVNDKITKKPISNTEFIWAVETSFLFTDLQQIKSW